MLEPDHWSHCLAAGEADLLEGLQQRGIRVTGLGPLLELQQRPLCGLEEPGRSVPGLRRRHQAHDDPRDGRVDARPV